VRRSDELSPGLPVEPEVLSEHSESTP